MLKIGVSGVKPLEVGTRTSDKLDLTCDQAFFFSGERESVAARESVVRRGRKKERLIQILLESSAAPCFANVMLSCVITVMLLMLANQNFTGNEYSLEDR